MVVIFVISFDFSLLKRYHVESLEQIEVDPLINILRIGDALFEKVAPEKPPTPLYFSHIWHLELVRCNLTSLGPYFSSWFPKLGTLVLSHNCLTFESIFNELGPVGVIHLVTYPNPPLLKYGYDDYRRFIINTMHSRPLMIDGIFLSYHEFSSTMDYFDTKGKFSFIKRREIDTRVGKVFGPLYEILKTQNDVLSDKLEARKSELQFPLEEKSPLVNWKIVAENSPWFVHDEQYILIASTLLESQLNLDGHQDSAGSLLNEFVNQSVTGNGKHRSPEYVVVVLVLLLTSIHDFGLDYLSFAKSLLGEQSPLLKTFEWNTLDRVSFVGLIMAKLELKVNVSNEERRIPMTLANSVYHRITLALGGSSFPYRLDLIGLEFLQMVLLSETDVETITKYLSKECLTDEFHHSLRNMKDLSLSEDDRLIAEIETRFILSTYIHEKLKEMYSDAEAIAQ